MFNFFKNNKGQNTAEYALLIALVVAGVIAMQQYAQRALQARVRDASTTLVSQTSELGNSVQYEPYYKKTDYQVNSDSTENTRHGAGLIASDSKDDQIRSGSETTTYNGVVKGSGDMPTGL